MSIRRLSKRPLELIIVQPYLPAYRRSFFELLRTVLSADQVNMTVVAPKPSGHSRARLDTASTPPWAIETSSHNVRLGMVTFSYYGSTSIAKTADLVVAPAAATCLDTHIALQRRRAGEQAIGVWGHIAPFVKPANGLDRWLETRQMRRADQVFAYTNRGLEDALHRGVDGSAVIAVQNTIDTRALYEADARLSSADVTSFRNRWELGDAHVYAYIGGVDKTKNIHLLASILDSLWERDRTAKLLVGGHGEQEAVLQRSILRGQTKMLGYVDDNAKALIARTASALLSTGRIGLLAVDALALKLPIIAAPFEYHAPEYDYLREGLTVFTAPSLPDEYADFLLRFSKPRLAERPPQLESMVDRFRLGILLMANSLSH